MKTIFIFIFMIFYSSLTFSKPIVLSFNKVDLNTFLDSTYGDILKRNYVQSPELLNQTRKVTLRVSIDDAQLPIFLVGFLSQLGIFAEDVGDVVYLSPKIADQQPIALAPPLPSAAPSMAPLGALIVQPDAIPATSSIEPRKPLKREISIFSPQTRTADFLCSVLRPSFGATSCNVAGVDLVLSLLPDDVDRVTSLLEKIDRRLPRVELHATFVEITTNNSNGLGLSMTASILGGALGVTVGAPGASGPISIKGSHFSAVLDALKNDGRFRQVASPSGFVSSGEHFMIQIGDEVPTLGNVQQDRQGNAVQSVVYRPSGVILDVLPRVVGNPGQTNPTRLEAVVKAQVSTFSTTVTGVNGSPTLSKREVNTVLAIDDGEIVIVGGLTGSNSSNSQLSLFGAIPFGFSDNQKSTELLLILSATVSK